MRTCNLFLLTYLLWHCCAVLDGLAEYQMLLMMAKLSTGWTLSSSFSMLDPKQMKQITAGVIAISVLEVCLVIYAESSISFKPIFLF